MTRRRRPGRQHPGRLHLSRPVRRPRPHLRQDPGRVRRPDLAGRARAGTLADARPRQPVRRRPARSRVVGVLRSGQDAAQGRQDDEDRQRHRPGRLRRTPRRHGLGLGEAQGQDPRPPQRREPRRRPAPRRDDPLPQPGRRRPRGGGAGGRAVRARAAPGRPALPVDAEDRLPPAHLRQRGRHRRLHQRAQGRGAGCRPVLDAEDAGRVLDRRLPARPLDGARVLCLERRASRAAPARSSCCSSSPAPAATSAATRPCRATGSPTGDGSTASPRSVDPTSSRRAASSTSRAGSTRGWSTRSRCCRSAPSAECPATPFTIRANLAFRNLVRAGMVRLASGQQMAALLRSSGVPVDDPHQRAASRRVRWCRSRPA